MKPNDPTQDQQLIHALISGGSNPTYVGALMDARRLYKTYPTATQNGMATQD